jgi:hypothetical protein
VFLGIPNFFIIINPMMAYIRGLGTRNSQHSPAGCGHWQSCLWRCKHTTQKGVKPTIRSTICWWHVLGKYPLDILDHLQLIIHSHTIEVNSTY